MKRYILYIPRFVAWPTISLALVSLFCASRVTAAATNKPPRAAADAGSNSVPKAAPASPLAPPLQAATSTGLSGRIVRFELFPDGVDMYESTQGFVVTEDLPARRLLATFPIVAQDDKMVVVDFNKGMRRVFTDAWTSEGELNFFEHDEVLEVPDSRVFEMRASGDRVIIRQSVQARSREFAENREARYEMRYFLSPYKQAALEGKELNSPDFRYLRYFTTDGHLEPGTGRVSSYAARFDLRQPLVFYYSANTPSKG